MGFWKGVGDFFQSVGSGFTLGAIEDPEDRKRKHKQEQKDALAFSKALVDQEQVAMLGEASSARRSKLRRGLSYNMFSSLAGSGLGGTSLPATSAGLKTLLGQ